jgi:hypothetical protein
MRFFDVKNFKTHTIYYRRLLSKKSEATPWTEIPNFKLQNPGKHQTPVALRVKLV